MPRLSLLRIHLKKKQTNKNFYIRNYDSIPLVSGPINFSPERNNWPDPESTHLCILRRNLCPFHPKANLARSSSCHLKDNLPNARAQVHKDVIFRDLNLVNHLTDKFIRCLSIHLQARGPIRTHSPMTQQHKYQDTGC